VPGNKVAAVYRKKQATAQQAEAVVDALLKVFEQPLFNWERPRVVVDTCEHRRTMVVWEEGPQGWMRVFPRGGMLGGTLWDIPKAELPKGVWVEPYDGCAISVYQDAPSGRAPRSQQAFRRHPLGYRGAIEQAPEATSGRSFPPPMSPGGIIVTS
jgi:hypothetical protein